MEKNNEKLVKMLTQPVEKLVCKNAIPSMTIMLISALYNMADTYFVSSLGTSATAAVGVVFPLMAIIQAVGFFFGHGCGNFISRALGSGDQERAGKMAVTGLLTAFSAGILIAVTGLLFLTPFNYLLGATATILPHSRDYMKFILIGAPFMASSLMLNNLLRFQGSALYGMIGMVTGALLNIVLDPLFIFVFKWGVSGAAIATMISQLVSFILLFLGCQLGPNVSIHLKYFTPKFHIYKEILRGGTPSLLRQLLASLATICLNQAARNYGDGAIAAISIVNRVTMFAGSALLGFGQGFQPVCGMNYGAKQYDRVKKAFFFCVKYATIVMSVLAVAGFVFAPQIIALFRKDDAEVILIGTRSLRFHCFTLPFLAWVTLNNMMMQTIGKTFHASILALSRQGLFLIPLLFILAPTLGLTGIQISSPIADFLTFLLSLPLSANVLKNMKPE